MVRYNKNSHLWLCLSAHLLLNYYQGVLSNKENEPFLDIDFDSIDVQVNSSIDLTCKGSKPLSWAYLDPLTREYKYDFLANSTEDNATFTSNRSFHFRSYLDTGTYLCFYDDNTKKNSSLYVFVNDPDHMLLSTGEPFMFVDMVRNRPSQVPCLPTNSNSSVSLWKDDYEEVQVTQSITFNPREGFTVLKPDGVFFYGAFYCKADLDNREFKLDLHLETITESQIIPQVHIDSSGAKYVMVGSSFSLKCSVKVESDVTFIMDWGYPVTDARRVFLSTEAEFPHEDYVFSETIQTLTISDARKEDAGLYQCNATDHSKKSNYYEVNVQIHDSLQPTVVKFTPDVDPSEPIIVNKDTDVELKSSYTAFPPSSDFNLHWFKDGVQLLNKIGKYQITQTESDGLLLIAKVNGTDSGSYRLTGEASGGVTNVTFNLHVLDVPLIEIEKPPSPYFAPGANYTIMCRTMGYPVPEVFWSWRPFCLDEPKCEGDLDWQLIKESHTSNNSSVYHVASDGYEFDAMVLQAQESGDYRCEAKNEMGSVQEIVPFIVTDITEGFEITTQKRRPIEMEAYSIVCMSNLIMYSNVQWNFLSDTLNDSFIPVHQNVVNSITPYSNSLAINFEEIKKNESGIYECVATRRANSSHHDRRSIHVQVRSIVGPSFMDSMPEHSSISLSPGEYFEIYCLAIGVPSPSVMWFKDDEVFFANISGIRLENNNQKLIISRLVKEDSGDYRCRAENKAGIIQRNFTLLLNSRESASTAIENENTKRYEVIAIAVITVVLSVVFVLLIITKIRQARKNAKQRRMFDHQSFRYGQMTMFNPEIPLDEQAELLPYHESWEFPKESLKLGRTLGQGAFGRVVKAEATGLNDTEPSTTVAVKMLKERADVNQQKALMAELKILIHLGHHVNIVNLLGAVTNNIQYGELYVIVEYCRYGNLRHYLIRHRDKFVDQAQDSTNTLSKISTKTTFTTFGKMSFSSSNSSNSSGTIALDNPNYRPRAESLDYKIPPKPVKKLSEASGSQSSGDNLDSADGSGKSYCRMDSREHTITTNDLLCYSFQCARGMEYLAYRKLIHRDLAARNILLADDNIVKICDFGLAKDCYKYSNYVKKGDGPLPIKWMAIESIGDKVFTTKSDVWSFGVLLWEFFSLGANPYPGIEVDEEFYRRLKIGYRMEKPQFCPALVYQIMRDSWHNDPNDRPNFTELCDILGGLLEESIRQQYIDLNNPYLEMNSKLVEHNYLNQEFDDDGESKYINTPDYDVVPPIRYISDVQVPKVAMEVVPMICLEPPGQHEQHYLQPCPAYVPDYLCMGESNIDTQDDDSVFIFS